MKKYKYIFSNVINQHIHKLTIFQCFIHIHFGQYESLDMTLIQVNTSLLISISLLHQRFMIVFWKRFFYCISVYIFKRKICGGHKYDVISLIKNDLFLNIVKRHLKTQ